MGLMDTVKGWFSKGKDMAGDMAEKAGDEAEGAWDKTKDVAADRDGGSGAGGGGPRWTDEGSIADKFDDDAEDAAAE